MVMQRLQVAPMDDGNIREMWPYIRARLDEVEDRIDGFALPESVFSEWLAGKTKVFLVSWENRAVGAIAVQDSTRDDGKKELWVWALGIEPGAPAEVIPALNEWLKTGARRSGFASVGMKSGRRGWSRRLASLGWKPVLVEYKLEV